MSEDIDPILRAWEYKSEAVQTRLIRITPEREVIQLRLDLGIMQMEIAGRPDGRRPEGFPTYFDYLKYLAKQAERAGRPFQLNDTHNMEADREFMQYYHRRICFLALRDFERAIADADHTLAFMDFIRDRASDENAKLVRERYRPFVICHRTQALAAFHSENGDAEKAIDAIQQALGALSRHYESLNLEEEAERDPFVFQLRLLDQQLRARHNIETTLKERLDDAIHREDYESAARLRDELRQRQNLLRTDDDLVS